MECSGLLHQPWQGHSDTETLLAAIEAWGLDAALQHSAGMFALALWDLRHGVLHLARDRFGEKPLYWVWLQQSGQQVFASASELAALPALIGALMQPVDPEALACFFTLGCMPAPLCIHHDIRQLPPAHLVSIPVSTLGQLPQQLPDPRPWWDLQIEASSAAAGISPWR